MLLALGWGCRGPQARTVEAAAVPIGAAPHASADARHASSVSDAQPAAAVDSHLACAKSVGSNDSSSGPMLEVDGPVWGVRELWLSNDGDFRYRSGEAGTNLDVFGLPDKQCDSKIGTEDVAALIDRLRATGACTKPESDATGGSARSLSVCMATGSLRCLWSAMPAKAPVWMTTISGFV